MDRAECVGPDLLFRLVAHYPLDGRTYVADRAVGLEDRDDVGRVLYQGAEALLTLLDYCLDLFTLGNVTDHTCEQPFPILVGLAEGHLDGKFAAVVA